jgi:hypothetical protein
MPPAYNLGNFGRPSQNQFMDWSPISLEENPIKVGRASRATAHGNIPRDSTADPEMRSQSETEYSRQFGIHLGKPG